MIFVVVRAHACTFVRVVSGGGRWVVGNPQPGQVRDALSRRRRISLPFEKERDVVILLVATSAVGISGPNARSAMSVMGEERKLAAGVQVRRDW